jgi:hypothetical protein
MTMHSFDLPRYRRLDDDEAEQHPAISFGDRESYLAWVVDWKSSWHGVVASIRNAKSIRRDRTRNDEDRFDAQAERLCLRVVAFNHLQLRRAAKVLAFQARQARQSGPLPS